MLGEVETPVTAGGRIPPRVVDLSDLELEEIMIDDAGGDHFTNAVSVMLVGRQIVVDFQRQITKRKGGSDGLEVLVKLIFMDIAANEISKNSFQTNKK